MGSGSGELKLEAVEFLAGDGELFLLLAIETHRVPLPLCDSLPLEGVGL